MWIVVPLICGLIFGAGLLISGMLQTTKVLDFLDVFGAWDPSLAVVMGAALAVSVPGFMLADRRSRPWLASQYFRPSKAGIDLPLVAGAALFGIGWGLVGLCPGPALESLATLSPGVIVFVGAMTVGTIGHDAWQQSQLTAERDRQLAGATDG
ncbi:DUF6691 family protein [Bradyrhizobium sp.]|uniref:DUF6691 family protein n=1 Tax=Bradyrhizobium sp. TaxID=376 RepID=UPI0025BADE2F|nr:DUF6691 family protein [Bradyrhizobium sp.]